MTALTAARDAFATIPGIASCKVGLEDAISPADYPMIRVVPDRITPGKPYSNRTAECLVYFGAPTTNAEGLEEVYADLLAIEDAIRGKLAVLGARYVETITDRDELAAYKLMAVRCELVATNPVTPVADRWVVVWFNPTRQEQTFSTLVAAEAHATANSGTVVPLVALRTWP
jgi:hypothetical protein